MATTVQEVKILKDGELVTPFTLAGSVKNLDGTSVFNEGLQQDLNMSGHSITGVGLQSGHAFVGSQGNSVLMPYINNSALGVSESATPEEYFLAYVKKLYTQYANSGLVSFTGSISLTGYGYGEISGYVSTYASHVDSDGEPYSYSFKVVFAIGKVLNIHRVNASDSIHVKQFDNNYDVNGKRTADIDMDGHSITNALVNVASHMTLGTEGNSYGGYQITTSEQLDNFLDTGKVKWAKVTQAASPFNNDGVVLSIGWRNHETRGYCRQLFFDEANHDIYSRGQSNSVWNDWLHIVGNTSSAVNSMGSNYIRYENGLQICWNRVSLSAIDISTAEGNIFSGTQSTAITFPVAFSSTPSVMANNIGGLFWVGRILASASAITQIKCYSANSDTAYTGNIGYIAIGKWK